ncbi:unnamed protein product [Discula destructiva]
MEYVSSVEKDPKHGEVRIVEGASGETDLASVTTCASIDAALERRCMRKFDLLVMPQIVLILILGYLDRSNIGNARVMGLEADTGLTGTQFNNIASLFFVTYSVFETPWALAIKAWGVNRTMATAIVGWSAITIGTGFAHNYHHFIACRLLLGVFESCIAPAGYFIISTIYPRAMQAKRTASINYGIAISGAFGGLIAYGVQLMGVRHGLASWRWLFIIEGIISLVFGCIYWVSLPAEPETAWFLTSEEKATMRAIRQREVAYRGQEKFEWKFVRMTLTDGLIWVAALSGVANTLPLLGFSLFAPTLILGLGYTHLQANYLSIPLYVVATLMLAIISWLSDKLNRRGIIMIFPACLGALGYSIVLGSHNPRVGYMAMFFVSAGFYSVTTLFFTWFQNNIAPDNKRIVATPIQLSFTVAAGAIASQIYPARDGPRYIVGNSISLAAIIVGACGCVTMWFVWQRRNARKRKLLAEGATVNKYEDDRRLSFTYVL